MAEAEFSEPDVIQNTPRLGPDDRFTFHCDPTLDCFGHCCQDVSILLTPYDVLRMKTSAGDRFLRVHGAIHLDRVLGGEAGAGGVSQDERRRQEVPVRE